MSKNPHDSMMSKTDIKIQNMMAETERFLTKLHMLDEKVKDGDLKDHMLAHIQNLKFILNPPKIK